MRRVNSDRYEALNEGRVALEVDEFNITEVRRKLMKSRKVDLGTVL